VLTQLLILFNYVEFKEGLASTTTSSGSSSGNLSAATVEEMKKITHHIKRLLSSTSSSSSNDGSGSGGGGSSGNDYSSMLSTLLHRERSWLQWKADKCPPIERTGVVVVEPTTKERAVMIREVRREERRSGAWLLVCVDKATATNPPHYLLLNTYLLSII